MTDKAQVILQRMKRRRGLFLTPETRDRVLGEFNASTLDPVGPIKGVSDDKFLSELNEMADLEGNAGRKSPDR